MKRKVSRISNLMMHMNLLMNHLLISRSGGKTKRRGTLFLEGQLEMCLSFLFPRLFLSSPLALVDVRLILYALRELLRW